MLKGASWCFDELGEELPNGLHDAQVLAIDYDLLKQVLSINLFVWVGTMDDPPATRERYRLGRLSFWKVTSFAKSVPYDLSDKGLTILSCAQNKDLDETFRAPAPATPNGYRLFTGYCEVDVECSGVKFEWSGNAEVNRNLEEER